MPRHDKLDTMRASVFRRAIVQWLPEGLLLATFLFFALRKLDTFPAVWADDGLFMIVAKMVAQGHGYTLPILGFNWPNPYILAVGPTLILPVALAMKLGGFSIAVARLPMVGYLLATLMVSYLYVHSVFGRNTARWNAALLLSFSAFINTGKPVLGEIPGFFFLLLGFALLRLHRSWWPVVGAGISFGLAAVTKLPYALIFPVLGLTCFVVLFERKWDDVHRIIAITGTAVLVFLAGAYWLGAFETGYFREIWLFALGGTGQADTRIYEPIFSRPTELFRMAYGHYVLTLLLAAIGWWKARERFGRIEHVSIALLALLFAAYFLNNAGWYRHLLPSTLLLFLFLPLGARIVLGHRAGTLLLLVIVALQGLWQYQYKGSSPSTSGRDAAQELMMHWQETTMIIKEPEVFFRLSENPRWLFFSEEMRDGSRRPPEIQKKMEETRCLPLLRRVSRDEFNFPSAEATQVIGRYFLFPSPADCPQ